MILIYFSGIVYLTFGNNYLFLDFLIRNFDLIQIKKHFKGSIKAITKDNSYTAINNTFLPDNIWDEINLENFVENDSWFI